VRPEAVEVLSEIGIDISSQWSKSIDTIDPKTIDTVITLCAEEACPAFLGKATRLHWGLADPAGVQGAGRLTTFRKTRDELRRRLDLLAGGRR
jgi:arsenate reductase